jgi:hypothetical protein
MARPQRRLELERRLLQGAVAVASIVPVAAGLSGILASAGMVKGVSAPLPPDLDSHFRYLSGLLFGIGLAFLACIPSIERRSLLFGALAAIVIVGGLARLLSLAQAGAPSAGHLFGLAMELCVVPLLLAWQLSLARRWASLNPA